MPLPILIPEADALIHTTSVFSRDMSLDAKTKRLKSDISSGIAYSNGRRTGTNKFFLIPASLDLDRSHKSEESEFFDDGVMDALEVVRSRPHVRITYSQTYR